MGVASWPRRIPRCRTCGVSPVSFDPLVGRRRQATPSSTSLPRRTSAERVAASGASAMSRTTGSVPEGRTCSQLRRSGHARRRPSVSSRSGASRSSSRAPRTRRPAPPGERTPSPSRSRSVGHRAGRLRQRHTLVHQMLQDQGHRQRRVPGVVQRRAGSPHRSPPHRPRLLPPASAGRRSPRPPAPGSSGPRRSGPRPPPPGSWRGWSPPVRACAAAPRPRPTPASGPRPGARRSRPPGRGGRRRGRWPARPPRPSLHQPAQLGQVGGRGLGVAGKAPVGLHADARVRAPQAWSSSRDGGPARTVHAVHRHVEAAPLDGRHVHVGERQDPLQVAGQASASSATVPSSSHAARGGSTSARYPRKRAERSASRNIPSPDTSLRAFHSAGLWLAVTPMPAGGAGVLHRQEQRGRGHDAQVHHVAAHRLEPGDRGPHEHGPRRPGVPRHVDRVPCRPRSGGMRRRRRRCRPSSSGVRGAPTRPRTPDTLTMRSGGSWRGMDRLDGGGRRRRRTRLQAVKSAERRRGVNGSGGGDRPAPAPPGRVAVQGRSSRPPPHPARTSALHERHGPDRSVSEPGPFTPA